MHHKYLKNNKRRYVYISASILLLVTLASIYFCVLYILELRSLITINTESLNKGSSFFTISIAFCFFIVITTLSFLTYFSVTQIKHKKALQKLAFEDPVTNGFNTNWLKLQLPRYLYDSDQSSFVLILLDIDKFKILNDAFGHKKGDEFLAFAYKCIQEDLSEDELVCRSDSDSFIIIMTYISNDEIEKRLDRISVQINQFSEYMEQKYYISMSCGICNLDKKEEEFFVILDRCQVALHYCAKTIGRSKFLRSAFFNEYDRIKLVEEKIIENKMAKALESNQFIVYLQPKYEIDKNAIAGAEALVRWDDPERGLIMPDDFIPLFEKNGFILTLDLFVFEQVCLTLRNWLDFGAQPIVISVNMSRTYLNSLNFLDKLEEIRKKYEIPSKYIELELTESIVYENIGFLLTIIEKIHSLGYTCSIDDFGSGYSSLNLLKNVPVDTLKLDRLFFLDTEASQERANAVVASVIDLARKLNMKTVSEGVENTLQVSFLKTAQCDLVQSFIFSKPVSISDFEKEKFGLIVSKKRILPDIDMSKVEGEFLMHDSTD